MIKHHPHRSLAHLRQKLVARLFRHGSHFLRSWSLRKSGCGSDAAFETLASLGPPADEEHAINSTIVRAHQHAAGVKGGIKTRKRSAARAAGSRPKSTSLTFDVTGGEAHEVKGYDALMELHDVNPDKLLGDKGYDSDDIRNDLNARGIEPMIPPRSNRTTPIDYDRDACKRRNLIERCSQAVPSHRHALQENRQSFSRCYASQPQGSGLKLSTRPNLQEIKCIQVLGGLGKRHRAERQNSGATDTE